MNMTFKNRPNFSSIKSTVEVTLFYILTHFVQNSLLKKKMDSKKDLNDAFIASTCDELLLLDLNETEFTVKEMPR